VQDAGNRVSIAAEQILQEQRQMQIFETYGHDNLVRCTQLLRTGGVN
jgi:hypothetical protein